jgi:hypothetical protein
LIITARLSRTASAEVRGLAAAAHHGDRTCRPVAGKDGQSAVHIDHAIAVERIGVQPDVDQPQGLLVQPRRAQERRRRQVVACARRIDPA